MTNPTQTPPVAFSHVGITVPDLERAVEFYTQALGLYLIMAPTTINHDESAIGQMCDDVFGEGWGSFRIAHLATVDGIGVELFQFPQTKPEQPPFEYWRPRVFHICLQDPDLEGRIEKIVAAGGKQRMKQVRYYFPNQKPYRMVYCEDPFGNIIELYSHSYELTYSAGAYVEEMAMARFKVVITDFDYGDNEIEKAILEPIGARVVALQAKREEELFEEARDCDAIMNQYARVGAKTIAVMQRCKTIARYGVGVDIVDVDAATKAGIQVTNVRDYCTEEVADHAIAMWLAMARKLADYDRATHKGVWHWRAGHPVNRLRGRTMGVVSFGKIGQAIAERARAFGVELVVYDPFVSPEIVARYGAEKLDKDDLLRRSDYLVMQAPMTPETRHFLGPREFSLIKPGAFIVNTGRGPTIDNTALYDALVAGRVAGAALDDPEEEPAKRASWRPDDNPLFTLPNVMVTPHVAYYSEESIRLAREIASQEVARVLTGQKPNNPVNTLS